MFSGSGVGSLYILYSLNLNGGLGGEPSVFGDFGYILLKYSIFRHVLAEILPKNIQNLFIIGDVSILKRSIFKYLLSHPTARELKIPGCTSPLPLTSSGYEPYPAQHWYNNASSVLIKCSRVLHQLSLNYLMTSKGWNKQKLYAFLH